MSKDILKQFPAILQNALDNNEVFFTNDTQFEYEPILAFRAIQREVNDNTPVNRNDMLSYKELNKLPRGFVDPENEIDCYGVSFFRNIGCLKNCFKFPTPHKKIAEGYIHQEGGPQKQGNNSHVNWWLYQNVSLNKFVIRSDFNEKTNLL